MASETIETMEASAEASQILEMCNGKLGEAIALLERQLNTLHNRAQVLFGFCGMVVTVTGFSGRLIAGTNLLAQILVVSGLVVVIACALYIFHSVMTLRWTTQRFESSNALTLTRIIERRNIKTRAYRIAGYVLFSGVALYTAAIAIMLLNPTADILPIR